MPSTLFRGPMPLTVMNFSKKSFVQRTEKSDQPRLDISAAGIALEIENRVERDFLAEAGVQFGIIAGGDEQFA